MTEAEWLRSTDPQPMLDWIVGKSSERKLRLFAVACCRELRPDLLNNVCRNAIDVAERHADGLASRRERTRAIANTVNVAREMGFGDEDARYFPGCADEAHAAFAVLHALGPRAKLPHASTAARHIWSSGRQLLRIHCQRLRCIIGNPFHANPVDPSWITENVVSVAHAIYDGRAFERMRILADALEDAGCDNADMLSHLRNGGEHARGCWVIDALTGRT
jgi:hypothetical protein